MRRRWLVQPDHLIPVVSLVVVVVAFASAPALSGRPLQPFDVYNALQGFAQLGLLALAIGITMIAGEFDLSVVGSYAVGGMLAVSAGATSPALGVLAAVAAGAAIGAVQGGLIARLRIPSMPVTLATYIALQAPPGWSFPLALVPGLTHEGKPAWATVDSNTDAKVAWKQAMEPWWDAVEKKDPGSVEQWYSPMLDDKVWASFQAPGPWGGALSDFDGIVWMRKRLQIPRPTVVVVMLREPVVVRRHHVVGGRRCRSMRCCGRCFPLRNNALAEHRRNRGSCLACFWLFQSR